MFFFSEFNGVQGDLTDTQLGAVFRACMEAAQHGTEFDTSDALARMAFNVLMSGVSRAAENYEHRSDTNRANANIRWHANDANGCDCMNETKRNVNESKRNPTNSGASPYTLDEVERICKEEELAYVKPADFIAYYQNKGWDAVGDLGEKLRLWNERESRRFLN